MRTINHQPHLDQVAGLLNRMYMAFDTLTDSHTDVYKVMYKYIHYTELENTKNTENTGLLNNFEEVWDKKFRF